MRIAVPTSPTRVLPAMDSAIQNVFWHVENNQLLRLSSPFFPGRFSPASAFPRGLRLLPPPHRTETRLLYGERGGQSAPAIGRGVPKCHIPRQGPGIECGCSPSADIEVDRMSLIRRMQGACLEQESQRRPATPAA
jgi:hypothetical protein